jgi:hypothetical protein
MQDSYDDDEYDDEYNDHNKDYKHYFKFDPAAWDAWGKMLYDTLNGFIDNQENIWFVDKFNQQYVPVNSYFSNTGKNKNFQYLGNNYQNAQIWKYEYFVYKPIQHQYINHLQSNAVHFVQQSHYYKGLFDILN